jgi:hypothetical protein
VLLLDGRHFVTPFWTNRKWRSRNVRVQSSHFGYAENRTRGFFNKKKWGSPPAGGAPLLAGPPLAYGFGGAGAFWGLGPLGAFFGPDLFGTGDGGNKSVGC